MTISSNGAFRQMLTIGGIVFICETLVMMILARLPPLAELDQAVADSTLLTAILAPVLYLFVYKPLQVEVQERREAERRAQVALDESRLLNENLMQAQEQLLASEKMVSMGHLAAGVAHEINNPVGFIGSNLSSLQRYSEQLLRLLDAYESAHDLIAADAERFAVIDTLRAEADVSYLKTDIEDLLRESSDGIERIKRIVIDLKDFSRADSDVFELADINAEIERTLNVARNELKYHVTVVKEFSELPPVECIAPQLNQVFLNLLVNAGQAIEGNGTVTISTAVADENVVISIADTGCGMTEAQLKKAFEPFYTTKPRGKGTGLGLSVSSGIVEKHRGRIEAQSKPGVGTTFKVEIPIKHRQVDG